MTGCTVECPRCGTTFDALRHSLCPSCGLDIDAKEMGLTP